MKAGEMIEKPRAPGGLGTRRPLILLVPDIVDGDRGATEREYSLRANYVEAIIEAGGLALVAPPDARRLGEIVDLAAGIVITGSGAGAAVAPERIAFERRLIADTLGAGKPLLGICHGMQMIGEHLGGQIDRDPPGLAGETTPHLPRSVPDRTAHPVAVAPESLIAGWTDGAPVLVNSLHRHILTGTGRFRVSARAPDGVAEAIEGLGPGFCLGVQWHPEYRLTGLDRRLLEAFVAACRTAG